jgi:enhancing lycopene biosynthesis protein 2
MQKKSVAVVLCGSGYLDGSEIREAVGTLWALSKHDVTVQCFAPNDTQPDVVNHLAKAIDPSVKRNMLQEAARIARSEIQSLDELNPDLFHAVIFPGGYGVAKSLCDFASQGAKGSVRPDIAKVMNQFHTQGKPIGAICIAPALVALVFKGHGFQLTLGPYSDAAKEIEKLGHKHIECDVKSCVVDEKNKIVTTPAYMVDAAPLHEIFQGIEKLVQEVLRFRAT